MSKEQIEEMARKNCHIEYHMKNYKTCKECYETNYCACRVYEVCRNLYNAGYRKQIEGEWIWTENGEADCEKYWVCSVCKEHEFVKTKYCPNCGAKMRKEGEGK